MSKTCKVLLIVVLSAIVVSAWAATVFFIMKGVNAEEMNGKVRFTFVPDTAEKVTDADMRKALTIVRNRAKSMDLLYCSVTLGKGNRINVKYDASNGKDTPGCRQEVANTLGAEAQLEFKIDGYNGGNAFLTGKDVSDAAALVDSATGSYKVDLTFRPSAAKAFADATEYAYVYDSPIVINMDGKNISSADVENGPITTGNAEISGNFTADTAVDLAAKINDGSLPFALRLESSTAVN